MKTSVNTIKQAVREAKGKAYSAEFVALGNAEASLPVKVIRNNTGHLSNQEKTLRFTLDNLLPLEEGQRPRLIRKLSAVSELQAAARPRTHSYPILSKEPLTWRDKQGWPKLVIMPLDQAGYVEIMAEKRSSGQEGWSYLPLCDKAIYSEVKKHVIDRCYGDVGKKLKDKCATYTKQFIRMDLGALLIPEPTRHKILRARETFKDQIFLVAEAGEWVEGKSIIPKPDPLIVGYEDQHLFLIDVFDLTSLEKLVASEYTMPQGSLL